MNLQQAGHSRSLPYGYGHRKMEKEIVARSEQKSQPGKTNVSKLTTAGVIGNKGGLESYSNERLLYLMTCLIGHSVQVQVKDGSVYSGIFHATNAEKDPGIILKMACEIKTGSSRGPKSSVDPFSKAPLRTFIIANKELVQMTAKDVSVTREDFENDSHHLKQQEIMIDSFISQHRHVDGQRELERWVPDEDDSKCLELDNIFDGPWNRYQRVHALLESGVSEGLVMAVRTAWDMSSPFIYGAYSGSGAPGGWDQFEANETLFGVKSTFDEDLYTTKLEKGPQMRELEREAMRIAREIEGEETQDLHLAEERGAQYPEHFDIDEETKYSSVFRGVDDSGYHEEEDILLDSKNIATFGDTPSSIFDKSFAKSPSEKVSIEVQAPSCSSSMEKKQSFLTSISGDAHQFDSSDEARHLPSELLSDISATGSEIRVQENQFKDWHAGSTCIEEFGEKIEITEETQTSKSNDMSSSLMAIKDGSDIASPNYTSSSSTSQGSNKAQEKHFPLSDRTENVSSVKEQGATSSAKTRGRPGSPTSSTSESGRVASAPNGPTLSPSSSVGSLSSEKSTLNPYAKEFRPNPNAKSFVPIQSPLRPASPVSDGSYYFPPNVPAPSHMHVMPVGIGVGPSYSPQPVIYNPQVSPMQSQQGYFHPNQPQYGQQMIVGHPQQLLYMPAYSPEMQYRGRDF